MKCTCAQRGCRPGSRAWHMRYVWAADSRVSKIDAAPPPTPPLAARGLSVVPGLSESWRIALFSGSLVFVFLFLSWAFSLNFGVWPLMRLLGVRGL